MVKNPLKILVDEMDDGMDEKLKEIGFDAYSVKKLRADGLKLHWSLKNNKKNFVRMLLRHEKCVKRMIRNLVRFVMCTQKEKMSLKSLCILKNILFLLQWNQNCLLIKNYKL